MCNSPDVDSSWLLWSREAEASVARAHLSAGGPPVSSPSSYVGHDSLSIYSMRLGGRCHDRIYHVDRSDEFDVTHFGLFLNSSLAPVLRFRRSFVSVCNVLKGIKLHGFSEARVAALWCRWRAVVRMGPTGPVTSFDPWTHWIPPDLHGFYKWAMDALALLNAFVLKVVRHRQTSRSIAWSNWIREDLTSRPFIGFALSLFLRLLIWFVSPKIPLKVLEFWSNLHLLMPIFERHGCNIFVVRVTQLSLFKPSWIL